jgi:ribosomal protein S24E
MLQSVGFYAQPIFAENTSQDGFLQLEFSPDTAQIIKQYDAGSDKWVICIQDYHANPDVQLSISEMIESICKQTVNSDVIFSKKSNTSRILVAIEGHSGNYVTSEIRQMQDIDQSLKNLLTDYFMIQGKLDGAEYLDIKKECPITLYGIEDKPLYEKNLSCFLNCINLKQSAKVEYNLLISSIEKNIDAAFSDEAKRIIELRKKYHDRSIDFKYLGYFITKYSSDYSMDIELYPALKELVSLLNEINKTNTAAVSIDAEKFSSSIFADKFPVSNKFLIQKVISDYKLKKIPLSAFVSSVIDIIADDNTVKDEFIAKYPTLWNFYDVQKRFTAFLDKYLPELDNSMDSFFDSLIATALTSKERDLYAQITLAEKIEKLISLELSSAQWDELNASVTEINSFLESQHKETLLQAVNQSCTFYELAVQRNSTMFNNMYDKLQEGFDGAILISGGFHTGAITKLLENAHLSYMVVVPKIDTIIDQQQYYAVMNSQPTPLEIKLDDFLRQTIKPPSASNRLLETIKKVSALSKRSLVLTTALIVTALALVSCSSDNYGFNPSEEAGNCSVDYPGENLVHLSCTGSGLTLDHTVNLVTYDVHDSKNNNLTGIDYYNAFVDIMIAIQEMIYISNGGYNENDYSESEILHFESILSILKGVPPERILIKDFSTNFDERTIRFSFGSYTASFKWPGINYVDQGVTINLNNYSITKNDGTILYEGDQGYYDIIDSIASAATLAPTFASGEMPGYEERTTEEILFLSKIRDKIAKAHAFVQSSIDIDNLGNGLYHLQADGRLLQLDVYFNINSFELLDSARHAITNDADYFSTYFNIVSALEELIKKAEGFYNPADTDEAKKQEYQNILAQWKQIPPQNILIQDFSASFGANKLSFNADTYNAAYTWPLNPLIASPTSIDLNTYAITTHSGIVLTEGDDGYYAYIDALMEASRNSISFASGEQGFTPLTSQDIIMLSKIRDKLSAAHAFVTPYLNIDNLGNGLYHLQADGRSLQLDVYFNLNSFDLLDSTQQTITNDADYFSAYFSIVSALEELVKKAEGFYDPADTDEAKKQEYQSILTQWKQIPPQNILIQNFSASFGANNLSFNADTYKATYTWPLNPLIASPTSIDLNTYAITTPLGTVLTEGEDGYYAYIDALMEASQNSLLFASGEQGYTPLTTKDIIMLSKIRDKLSAAHAFTTSFMNLDNLGNGLYHLQVDGRSIQLDTYFNLNSFDLLDSTQQTITNDADYFATYFTIVSALEELIKKAEGFYDPAEADEAKKQEYQSILTQWKQIPPDNILIQDFSTSFNANSIQFNAATSSVTFTWPANQLIALPTAINLNDYSITLSTGEVITSTHDSYTDYLNAVGGAARDSVLFAAGEQNFPARPTQELIILSKIRDKISQAPLAGFGALSPSDADTRLADNLIEIRNIQSIEAFLSSKLSVSTKISDDAADTYAWAGVTSPVLSALQYYGPAFIQSRLNGANPSLVELITDDESGSTAEPATTRIQLSDIISLASAHEATLQNAVNNLRDQLQVAVFYSNPQDIEQSAIKTAQKWVVDNQEVLTEYPARISSLFNQKGLLFGAFVGLNLPLPLQISILNSISSALLSLLSSMMTHQRLPVRGSITGNKIIAVNPSLIAQRVSDFRFQSNLNSTTAEMLQDLIDADYSIFVPVLNENDLLVIQDAFSTAGISPDDISVAVVRHDETSMDTLKRTFPESSLNDIVFVEKQSALDNGQLMHSAFDRAQAKTMKIVGVRNDTLLEDALGIAGYLTNINEEDYQDPQLVQMQLLLEEYLAGAPGRVITPETIGQLIQSLQTNGYVPTFQSTSTMLNYMNMIRSLTFISASLSAKFTRSPFNTYVWLENGNRVNLRMPVAMQVDNAVPTAATIIPKKHTILKNQELLDSMI